MIPVDPDEQSATAGGVVDKTSRARNVDSGRGPGARPRTFAEASSCDMPMVPNSLAQQINANPPGQRGGNRNWDDRLPDSDGDDDGD